MLKLTVPGKPTLHFVPINISLCVIPNLLVVNWNQRYQCLFCKNNELPIKE